MNCTTELGELSAKPALRVNLAGLVADVAKKVMEGHHEVKGWEHLRLDGIAWVQCLAQAQARHAKGALFSRDDEADTLPAEPEVTIDEAGEVDWTEVTLPAEA
eukprot:5593588-Amphidinium_carterae.1